MKQSGAGRLREIVAFESRAIVDDGLGNEISGDWTERFKANAEISFLKGGESVVADRLQGMQPAVIAVRYEPQALSANTDWRIKDLRSGVVYQIKSQANMDKRREFLEFLTVAGVAG